MSTVNNNINVNGVVLTSEQLMAALKLLLSNQQAEVTATEDAPSVQTEKEEALSLVERTNIRGAYMREHGLTEVSYAISTCSEEEITRYHHVGSALGMLSPSNLQPIVAVKQEWVKKGYMHFICIEVPNNTTITGYALTKKGKDALLGWISNGCPVKASHTF